MGVQDLNLHLEGRSLSSQVVLSLAALKRGSFFLIKKLPHLCSNPLNSAAIQRANFLLPDRVLDAFYAD